MFILNSAAIRAKKGDVVRPLTSRGSWGLILVRKGKAFCSTGLKECMISSGNILVVPRSLDLCILPSEEYEHIDVEMSEQILPGKDQFFCLHDDSHGTGAGILWLLSQQFRYKPANYQNVINALAEALRQFLLAQTDQGPNSDMLELEQMLRSNISNASFQVTAVLAQIPQTPSYTRRLFHEAYGCSPRAYLTNLRIGAAKVLLMSQNLPIAEVAYRCGFADAKSFARRFHQATGYTPTEFKLLPKKKRNP